LNEAKGIHAVSNKAASHAPDDHHTHSPRQEPWLVVRPPPRAFVWFLGLGRRWCISLFVTTCAADVCCGDLLDVISVDEPQPSCGGHHDAMEDVLRRVVEDAFDGSKLVS
jgi:hypothetical protein